MAASGYTPIILFNSTTTGNTPTTSNLAVGELAINVTDGKLFLNQSGTIKVLANATYATSVSTISFGTTGLTPSTATNGVVTVAGTLATTNGGTGLTSFTSGGVVYASSTSALATGSALTFDGNKLVTNALSFNYYTGAYTLDGTISNYASSNSLYVNGNAGGYLSLQGAGNQKQQIGINGSNSGGEIFFQTNGLERARFDSSGNLGIGTTSPSTYGQLAIIGSSAPTAFIGGNISGGSTLLGALKFGSTTSSNAYINAGGQIASYSIGGVNQCDLRFYTSNSGSSTQVATIDYAGNLGLGVTPSAWSSSYKAIQLGSSASLWGASNAAYLALNAYQDAGGTNRYLNTNFAVLYGSDGNGGFQWRTAPSGTAGTAISFTQAMTLNSSGYVGIGTTTINSNLSLGAFNTAGTSNSIRLYDDGAAITSTSNNSYGFGFITNGLSYTAGTSGSHQFYTANAERMRIDSSGNVGIGTTSPTVPLQVIGSVGGYAAYIGGSTYQLRVYTDTAQVQLNTGGGEVIQFLPASNALTFATNGSERARIDSSGNLLVGITTPYSGTVSNITATTGVDIGSSSTATSKQLQFIRNGSTGTAGSIYATAGSFTNYCGMDLVIENVGGGSQAGYLKFNTTNNATVAERMRISSAGSVYVNTTSALSPDNAYLSVAGSSSVPCITVLGGAGPWAIKVGTTDTSSTRYMIGICNNSGATLGGITTNGTVITYGGTSDYRLKENVQPLSDALEKISQLKPVTYTWKSTGAAGNGFIAHELAEVFPDAVAGEKDALEENGSIKAQMIDPSKLVATLTAAIQEQQALITAQSATIQSLTERITALEGART